MLAFSPDGTKLVTAAGNLALAKSGELRLWDVATCQPLGEPMVQDGVVTHWPSVPTAQDRHGRGGWHDWQTPHRQTPAVGRLDGQAARAGDRPRKRALRAGLQPRRQKLATGSAKVTRMWDVATGQPAGQAMTHDAAVTAVAFSLDGAKLATAGDDMTARLWEAATGQPSGPPMKHDSKVTSLPSVRTVRRSQRSAPTAPGSGTRQRTSPSVLR